MKTEPMEWPLSPENRKRMAIRITVMMLVMALLIFVGTNLYGRYLTSIYIEALDHGYHHRYEEAIELLEALPFNYRESQLHIWRFYYALIVETEVFPINFQMEREGWIDAEAIMNRNILFQDIVQWGDPWIDIPNGWGEYSYHIQEYLRRINAR